MSRARSFGAAVASIAIAVTCVGCANGVDDGSGARPGDASVGDATTGDDATTSDDAAQTDDVSPAGDGSSSDTNASTADARVDTKPSDAGALDPSLGLPDEHGAPCTAVGTSIGCPGGVCRIAGRNSGRCESCNAPCRHLGEACRQSSDCDTLFQCFHGKCEGFCQLGSTACGAPSDCIDVGNATTGVCRPL